MLSTLRQYPIQPIFLLEAGGLALLVFLAYTMAPLSKTGIFILSIFLSIILLTLDYIDNKYNDSTILYLFVLLPYIVILLIATFTFAVLHASFIELKPLPSFIGSYLFASVGIIFITSLYLSSYNQVSLLQRAAMVASTSQTGVETSFSFLLAIIHPSFLTNWNSHEVYAYSINSTDSWILFYDSEDELYKQIVNVHSNPETNDIWKCMKCQSKGRHLEGTKLNGSYVGMSLYSMLYAGKNHRDRFFGMASKDNLLLCESCVLKPFQKLIQEDPHIDTSQVISRTI